MASFRERTWERWRRWWATPLKWWEHALVCVSAVIYFGLIGSIAAVFFAEIPIFPLDALFLGVIKWGASAAAIGGVLAFFFPKVILCIIYPFAIFGIGEIEVG